MKKHKDASAFKRREVSVCFTKLDHSEGRKYIKEAEFKSLRSVTSLPAHISH